MKAPVRWLDEPDALPDELLASMQAYREAGPSAEELAQIRRGANAARFTPAAWKWLVAVSLLAGLGGALWAVPRPVPVAPPRPAPVVVAPAPVGETQVAPVVPVEPTPVRTKRGARAQGDAAAELLLLRRARRLIASDPAGALSLTDEHLHSYPFGVFAEERELLAIEALAQRDRAAAVARARSFASKYPRSVHQARIEAALGAH